jgi:hypothetical protein
VFVDFFWYKSRHCPVIGTPELPDGNSHSSFFFVIRPLKEPIVLNMDLNSP